MESAAKHASLGNRGRRAVGLALVASGAVGITGLVSYFAGAPTDWLFMLASGVAGVLGAIFIVPVCGALLALVARPWLRRIGWASVVYGALVVVWAMSVIAGVPWSKDVGDVFLLLGVYAALPLDVAVFILSITTGAALLRTQEEPGGIAVRRFSPRAIVYGSIALVSLALMAFGLMVLWAR